MQRFAVVAAVVLAVTGAGTGRAPAQQAGERDWFHLDTTLAEGWQAVEVGGEKSSVLLRSADSVGAGARRHILSLQARASSAYDVALSEVARVLGQKRISSDILAVNYEDEGNRAASALKQAERSGFDMVLATGSEATAWLLKTYRGGRLPVVSVCAKDPVALGQAKNYTDGTGTNFALTSLNLPADVQMAYALELMPGLRNLAIIVDGQNISAMETQALPIAAQAQARGIRVLNVTVQNPGRAAEELDRLVGDAVEAMRLNDVTLESSLFLVTGSTSVFEQMGIVNARASRVPVISMVPETVHEGSTSAVLSIGVSFRSNAHLAAVYAAGILERGQRPGSLKIGVLTPPDIEINFRRAREIGLKIPFTFFESANIIYDYADKPVRTTSAADR
jgi:putative ABC transport system substrate-binding protein